MFTKQKQLEFLSWVKRLGNGILLPFETSREIDVLQVSTFSEQYRDHIHARFVVNRGRLVYVYVIWTPKLCSMTRTWKLSKPYWSEDEAWVGEDRDLDGHYYDRYESYLIKHEDVKISGLTWSEVAKNLLHCLNHRLTSEQVQELEEWVKQLS